MAIDNVTFVKALASAASQEFKDRIGATTQANSKKIGETVTTYPTLKNEFVNVLTNQVSKQLFFNKVWENPYKMFNRGQLPYGKSIESIFNQTYKANKIVLYISKDHFTTSTLPHSLLKQQKRGLEIRFVKDIGPYTKLIPALKEFPNANIITIDDDYMYPFDMIEKLVKAHLLNPQATSRRAQSSLALQFCRLHQQLLVCK